jgi:hypothetical protein
MTPPESEKYDGQNRSHGTLDTWAAIVSLQLGRYNVRPDTLQIVHYISNYLTGNAKKFFYDSSIGTDIIEFRRTNSRVPETDPCPITLDVIVERLRKRFASKTPRMDVEKSSST